MLFSWRGGAAVIETEICRALWVADLALIVMTCAWIVVASRSDRQTIVAATPCRKLNLLTIQVVSLFAIPLGFVAMLLWSHLPGIAGPRLVGDWASSSWIVIAQTWAGLGLLALIYWYGFKPWLVVPLVAYFGIAVYQGNYRFRLLIPLILLVQIYTDRQSRRWPKFSAVTLLLFCTLLLFPLKDVGRGLQSGESFERVMHSAQQGIGNALSGKHPDEMILDEFAGALTLADQHGRLYWGGTYAGLLTVAVPRQWWPEKPGLADFEKEISTPARPFGESGMVVTMLGEFYLNFSYVGVVVLSFVVAYLTGSWFHAAYRRSYFTLGRFVYLLIACNLIQVFRDGLISLFVFTIINMLPLSLIAIINLVLPSDVQDPTSGRQPMLTTARVRSRLERHPTI